MGSKRKRTVPRRLVEQPIGVLARGIYSIAVAYELGEGGMLVKYDGALETDQRIVVTFSIDRNTKAITSGIVRYGRAEKDGSCMYGVEFDNLDFKVKRLIRNFVASWARGDSTESQLTSWKDRQTPAA